MNLLFWYRSLMRSVGAALVKLIATATSGLVSFTTNVIRPAKVTCEFSPVQEGTGDPSPDNVRPISGWTGCNLSQAGGNLWNPDTSVPGYLNVNDGTIVAAGSTTKEITSDYIPVPSGTEAISLGFNYNVTVKWKALALYDANKTFIARPTIDNVSFGTINISSYTGVAFCRACLRSYGNSASYAYLAYGNDITYKPYTGHTIPITFTDPTTGDPLTVYGGTVTLNEDGSADLAGTRLSIEFDGSADENWHFEKTANGYKNAYIAMPSTFKTSQISSTEMICSASPTNATKIGTTYRAVKDACYISNGRNFNFCWLDTLEISSANDFKAWLQDGHSLQVVATLINPITYHFDNIGQLQSFLGTNNIWHNMNGSITAEYYKKQ